MHSMEVFNTSSSKGEKRQGSILVKGTNISLPYTIIYGERPGKTVLITAGIHNAEYVGIQAAMELAEELKPEQITGNLIILPLMNPSGFEHRTMSVVYEDGKNLNRVFPGNPNGTEADKTAYFLEENLFPKIDYYIDLHSGDGFEELTPYVYCQGKAEDWVKETSLRMAQAVNVPYIAVSGCETGGAYNYAGKCSIPGILLERGNLGLWNKKEVAEDKGDVLNILVEIGVLQDEKQDTVEKTILTNIIYESAGDSGCWYPEFHAGDMVKKGDVLGRIKDYFGETKTVCHAKMDGVVLYQTASLCIQKNSPMIAYGEIK